MNIKRYLIDSFIYFIIPLLIIAIAWEFSIRSIPNDYSYKSKWLKDNAHDIEVLYLGPSTVMYDIDPTTSKWKGFNAAHVSQSLKYDHFIFDKYINQMTSLKQIVLGIDYWSPHGQMEQSTEWWRVKYYTIHYNSPYHENKFKYKYELYFHNPRTLKIAAQGAARILGMGNVSHLNVNNLGYGTNYNVNNKLIDWDNGVNEAMRHNELIKTYKNDKQAYEENLNYVSDICKLSEERGIKVILLAPPIYKSYTNTLDNEYINDRNAFCQSIADKYSNTTFLDLSNSDLFAADDFYDANHLNDEGTRKMVGLMDEQIEYSVLR
ncbi:MAG: DUF1574 family protein [Proteiniphilum sp.]|nr:DUF1574 family protein [Proteiniphilum sp.]